MQCSGDGKKRELATGGPDSKDGFEPQGQGSREPHERRTNGNSFAGSQALSQHGALKISNTGESEPQAKPLGFEEAALLQG